MVNTNNPVEEDKTGKWSDENTAEVGLSFVRSIVTAGTTAITAILLKPSLIGHDFKIVWAIIGTIVLLSVGQKIYSEYSHKSR